jgi:hypothetical protein
MDCTPLQNVCQSGSAANSAPSSNWISALYPIAFPHKPWPDVAISVQIQAVAASSSPRFVKLKEMPARGSKILLLVCVALMATALAQVPAGDQSQPPLTTREHLAHEHWWPTKQFADQSQFAGVESCAACHAAIVRSQVTTQMALTMTPASKSTILASHTGNIFTFGPYHYAIEKAPTSFKLKVSDGTTQNTVPLEWAFGSTAIAQSYVWWQNNDLVESRFNYFTPINAFDRTPGRLQDTPLSLDMATGRKMASFEARNCLSCHATALTTAEPLKSAQFFPGVSCEACHGPGRAHIAAMKAGNNPSDMQIVSPATLTPAKSVEFCGACHGAPKDVELMGTSGNVTARFPAYRIVKSRCWGASGDARLTCFACHNPHRPLERDPAAYDAACLRCHANGAAATSNAKATQAACPVAKSRCTSCHMQKVKVAVMHYDFTDHQIRIAKANEPFPE